MGRLPIGLILLIIVSILVYLGLAHRVLDRMRLSDRAALGVLAAMMVGSLIDIPIPVGRTLLALNVGGALVPLGLAVYLVVSAEQVNERIRAIFAALVTGVVVYAVGTYLMTGLQEPAGRFEVIDVVWLYPLVAGITAYVIGRSRRAAFVGAAVGVLLADVLQLIRLARAGLPGVVHAGGAGAFDVLVLASLFAVLLAEVIGEVRERLGGGPRAAGRDREMFAALKNPEEEEGGNGQT